MIAVNGGNYRIKKEKVLSLQPAGNALPKRGPALVDQSFLRAALASSD